MMPLFSHRDRDPIFGGAVRNVIPSNYGCNPINYIYCRYNFQVNPFPLLLNPQIIKARVNLQFWNVDI